MPLPPNISRRPSLTRRFLLKRALCLLILLLVATTVYDLSRRNTTVDYSKIVALVSELNEANLTERGLELVEGTLHEPSDPARKCQGNWVKLLPVSGTVTLTLKDSTEVKLTISECHPCNWPVKLGQDISAYVHLDVESSSNHLFSISSFTGGLEEHSSGSFRLHLPVNVQARSRIRQIIQQISEHGMSPKREEFNLVLEEILSSRDGTISDVDTLCLGALICNSVDLFLKSDKSP